MHNKKSRLIFCVLLLIAVIAAIIAICFAPTWLSSKSANSTSEYLSGFHSGSHYAAQQTKQLVIGTYYVDTEEDPLTIRSDANQEADKLGTIPKGQNIEITEISGHWGNTTYNGISGWVNLNYCARGENPNPVVDETTVIVHVTVTGECYHRAGCGYLKSDIPISLEEAERKGYRPCSRCY